MPRLPLEEINYFGTAWYAMEKAGSNSAFVLSEGWRNAQVVRSADGLFFAGIVEKTNGLGQVTDVVLAFAGTQPAIEDLVSDAALLLALGDAQAAHAAALYDSLIGDPIYAGATVHVTGHSLGAAFTEYVLGHSLAFYGADFTETRADFTKFGAPPWGDATAMHFGLSTSDFDGRIIGYAVENDPIQLLGTQHLGVQHLLEMYEPFGPGPLFALLNGAGAHHSSAYLNSLGLPDWLTAVQRDAVVAAVTAEAGIDLYDPDYGVIAPVAQHVIGDGADNLLAGTAADDIIEGRGGADLLTGSGGADRFVVKAPSDSAPGSADRILDLDPAAGDRIDVSAIDAAPGNLFVNTFTFVGAAAFSGAGQLRYAHADGETIVAAELNGDGAADLVIHVAGTHHLAPADFLL